MNFAGGGAFPELHVIQYPMNLGREAKKFPTVATTSVTNFTSNTVSPTPHQQQQVGASTALVVQTASSQLDEKRFAVALLAKPTAEETEQHVQRTQRAVEERLKELGKGDRIVDTQVDPFAVKMTARKSNALTITTASAADPAAIIRSPTKKKVSEADLALASVPMCISSWSNPKNAIIPLELRQAADTTNKGSGAISHKHVDLVIALQAAQKTQEKLRGERELALQAETERKQSEQEAEAAARAKELLKQRQQLARNRNRDETREQRQERIKAEQQQKERDREEERHQRRLRSTALRIGTTVEELERDKGLMSVMDDYASGIAAGGGFTSDARAQEPSTSKRPRDEDDDTAPMLGARVIINDVIALSNRRIEEEMMLLGQERYQQPQQPDVDDNNDDDDDEDDEDDDPFQISSLLKKKPRGEK